MLKKGNSNVYTDLSSLSLNNKNYDVSNLKPMNWSIPIDYTKKVKDKTLEPNELKSRQTIIEAFLNDSINGCNEDTKALANIIFIQQKNLFLTGNAGCGKTYQLRLIYKLAKKIYSNSSSIAITSTTGTSVLNLGIPEGTTVHSWSKLLIEDRRYRKMVDGEYEPCFEEGNNYLKNANIKIKNTELLFIEEISLLGGYYIKILDAICKQLKKNENPFGNIQIVFIGDLCQLSPVNDVYPFLYKVWDHLNFFYYKLTKCYRQTDKEWSDILNKVRVAHVFTRGGKTLSTLDSDSIKKLQSRNFKSKYDVPDYCLFLYNKNKDVAKHNLECLNKIEGEIHTSVSIDSILVEHKNERLLATNSTGKEWDEINDFSLLSSGIKRQISKNVNSVLKEVEENVQLKIGALVLLRKNLDKKAGLINGSRGLITNVRYIDEEKLVEGEITKVKVLDKILVQFSTRGNNSTNFGLSEVDFFNYEKESNSGSDFIGNEYFQAISNNESWFSKFEFINVEYLSPTLRIIRKRIQFPFILAFAISTHKSQGSTVDDVIFDMSECFQPHQAYVALSRCKTLERTYLLNFNAKYLYSSPKCIHFDKIIDEKRVNKEN